MRPITNLPENCCTAKRFSGGASKYTRTDLLNLYRRSQTLNGARETCAPFRIESQTEKMQAARRLVLAKTIRPTCQLLQSDIARLSRSPSHGSSARMRFAGFLRTNPACLCWPTGVGPGHEDTGPSGYLNPSSKESTGSFLMRNRYTSSKHKARYARNLPASSKTLRASSRR